MCESRPHDHDRRIVGSEFRPYYELERSNSVTSLERGRSNLHHPWSRECGSGLPRDTPFMELERTGSNMRWWLERSGAYLAR
jgi:hypothetical protein